MDGAIEVNRDFKSIASLWLGIDASVTKTDHSNDVEVQESLDFPKVKLKSSQQKKNTENIRTIFSEEKKKNGRVPTALFVGGKLERKLKKAKRRKDEDKHADDHHSSTIQEKYLDEDSKVSIVQKKTKAISLPERTGLCNSVENIKQLLAVTENKKQRKKLRKKLKKLLSKSSDSRSITDRSESTKSTTKTTETASNKDKSVQNLKYLFEKAIHKKSKKKKKIISETSVVMDESLSKEHIKTEKSLSTFSNSKQIHEKKVCKKSKKKKRKKDEGNSTLSLDYHSDDEHISSKDHKKKYKNKCLSHKSLTQLHDVTGSKLKKKKRKHKNTEAIINSPFEDPKVKSEESLPLTQEFVNKKVKTSDLGKKKHTKLKRKKTVSESDNVNDITPVKIKKHKASPTKQFPELHVDIGYSSELADKPSEEGTSKEPRLYKRKRTKKRSKQKNIRKDHRPDHLKPAHLRKNESEATV